MKRIAWMLTLIGILCVAASQVHAHDYYRGHHGHPGWAGPAVVYRHGPPAVIVAPRLPPPVPAYRYRYCYPPVPGYGFYYQGRGVSVGIGF